MKTPRINDFDPDAKAPNLKSSLDRMPAILKPPTHFRETLETQQQQDNQGITERPNASTPVRPKSKRIITRNSFETYEDQMDSLRKLSYQEKMEGQLGSMSKMVRDALDQYILKRTSKNKNPITLLLKPVRPFASTPERATARRIERDYSKKIFCVYITISV